MCLMGLMHLLSPARSRDQWSLRPSSLLPSIGHESSWDPLALSCQPSTWGGNPATQITPCLFKSSKTKPRGGECCKVTKFDAGRTFRGADVLWFFCNHCKAELCWVLACSQHKPLVTDWGWTAFGTVCSSWNTGAVWNILHKSTWFYIGFNFTLTPYIVAGYYVTFLILRAHLKIKALRKRE